MKACLYRPGEGTHGVDPDLAARGGAILLPAQQSDQIDIAGISRASVTSLSNDTPYIGAPTKSCTPDRPWEKVSCLDP